MSATGIMTDRKHTAKHYTSSTSTNQ